MGSDIATAKLSQALADTQVLFHSELPLPPRFHEGASMFMTESSFFRSVFFISLRFTGSSEGGIGVIGRFGDFIITRFFVNTFSCVSGRFSPRPELIVVVVSGSVSISPCMS